MIFYITLEDELNPSVEDVEHVGFPGGAPFINTYHEYM